MPRVDEDEVRAIIKVGDDADLTSFIQTATVLVDEVLVPPAVLSAARLKEIELYLAAHFAAIRFGLKSRERVDVAEKYFVRAKPGMGLEATDYGQQALALDTTGTLKALNAAKGRTPRVAWLGTLAEDYPDAV